jgi:hypothetical protein
MATLDTNVVVRLMFDQSFAQEPNVILVGQ